MTNFPKEIDINKDNSLNFGNYETKHKIKVNDFKHAGDTYNLRSHNLVTRLEKNGEMVMEVVPGAYIANFALSGDTVVFEIAGEQSAQITLGLTPETAYKISIAGGEVSEVACNISGKLTFGVELTAQPKKIEIKA